MESSVEKYPVQSLKWFRIIGISEGVSYLLLLLVAMPLKYFAGLPIAVTIVGAIHGALFIAFMIKALELPAIPPSMGKINRFTWLVICFIAAVLPFGTFVLDRKMKS